MPRHFPLPLLSKTMKKLYRKSTVHPSPPASSSDLLAFLPASIFTLTAALTLEEKEVLAYLLNSSNTTTSPNINMSYKKEKQHRKGCSFTDHSVQFSCSCFRCYMSYWIRWDSSPNRHLIHEIIDAFEDQIESKKIRRGRKGKKGLRLTELTRSKLTEFDSVQTRACGDESVSVDGGEDDEGDVFSDDGLESDKGSMRKFVSFIGGRIWGVLGAKDEENDDEGK